MSILFRLLLNFGHGLDDHFLGSRLLQVVVDINAVSLEHVCQLSFVHLEYVNLLVLALADQLLQQNLSHDCFLLFLEHFKPPLIQVVNVPLLFKLVSVLRLEECLEVPSNITLTSVGFLPRLLVSVPEQGLSLID